MIAKNKPLPRCLLLIFSLLISIITLAQKTVSGKVINNTNGEPISGATVQVKNTKTITNSNEEGFFTITVPAENSVLTVTVVGFEAMEIPVAGKKSLSVALIESTKQLSDVIVVGYTSQRKVDITGSVSIVDVKTAKQIPTVSAEQLLQGQAPGVTVISSGAPGARSNVFIRGISSFGDVNPLYIIDGVQGDIHNINPNDIQSMQILKDAGAASIYGVRGSNGVVIITTKKGRNGKTVFSYDLSYGIQQPLSGNPFHLLNTQEMAALTFKADSSTILYPGGIVPDFLYQGNGNKGAVSAGNPAVDPSKYNFNELNPSEDYLIAKVNKEGTNWFQEIFHTAPFQTHNFSASGGNDKNSYFLSLGYLNQQGTLRYTYEKKYTARINNVFNNLKKTFRFGQNVYVFYRDNPGYDNQSETSPIGNAYRMQPMIPVHDIKGNFAGTWVGPAELGNAANPVAILYRLRNNKNRNWDVIGNVFAEVDFLKHFTARTSFGGTIDNNSNYIFSYNAYEHSDTHSAPPTYSENSYYNSTWIWTNTLNYSHLFGKHQVKVLAGQELISNYGRSLGGSAGQYFTLDPNYVNLSTGGIILGAYSNAYQNSLYSFFGRVDYNFDNKYILGATIRKDASSKFAVDKNTGYFPAASLGWRISEESFLHSIKWIKELKLRASYGILGSQANVQSTNPYTIYGSGFGSSYYAINGGNTISQGVNTVSFGNAKTTWERDKVTNIGIDASILNHHIDFSLEYYKKSISGLLFADPIPATAGVARAPIINIGNVENKGWDVSATYHGSASKDFKFDIGLNLTTYKNNITSIPGEYFGAGTSRLGDVVRNQVGHPISSFFGYQVVNLFSDSADVAKSPTQVAAAPGRFKFADLNGDGKITSDDRTFIGNPNPDFTYGVNLNSSFKNFDLTVVLYGSQGNQIFNYTKYFTDFLSTFNGAKNRDLLYNSWSPTNLNAKTPKVETANNFSNSGTANSYYVEKGSFLKLRSMQLGYNVRQGMLQRFGIEKLRVYVQAINLFTITKYSGLDPELVGNSAAFGIDYGNYPNNQKSFVFGVNLSF